MTLRALIFAITILATAAPAYAETPEAAAESAALEWLGLLDAASYAQSWSTASTLFRQSVSEAQWQSAVSGL